MDGLELPPRKLRRKGIMESDMLTRLSNKVIGQDHAMRAIVPFVQMYEAGLGPEGRPAGVFLLLGPTGTGKTRTVEALAEVLHGHRRNLLRIDCGEYQMDHEVAKLTGAPPGYLGHRETHPVLTQARLASVTSEKSSISLVLFDEIEKAAPSMTRLLLGILDKATLRLGDNNIVNFDRTLIFLTSNVGASKMQAALNPGMGFHTPESSEASVNRRLDTIAMGAARKAFAPEFLNRIDECVTYQPLSTSVLESILQIQLFEFQQHINHRLGAQAFRVEVPKKVRQFLLQQGTSTEYGAREIRRAVHKYIAQPVAALVTQGRARPGSVVRIGVPEWAETADLPIAA